MSIMVSGGSEAKWISITLFRANVLKTKPCFWFLYAMICLVCSLETGTGKQTVKWSETGRSRHFRLEGVVPVEKTRSSV